MDSLSLLGTDYHGKYSIAELYRDAIAAPIIARQCLDIDPDDILCLLDDGSTAAASYCAKVFILPEIVADVVYQLSGRRYSLMLRLSQAYLRNLEPERIAYYVYDALRHVAKNDKGKYCLIREHDVCVWREILPYVAGRKPLPDMTEVRVYEVGEGADNTVVDG